MTRAVFLDRDGVICENRDDYVKSWREFIWISGAGELANLSQNEIRPDYIAANLLEAVKLVLRLDS